MILFIVRHNDAVVATLATGREMAKRKARGWLGGDPDGYIVEPVTRAGDTLYISDLRVAGELTLSGKLED